MIEDESPFIIVNVGVGEDVFVHAAVLSKEVIEEELLHVSEQGSPMKDREDLPVVSSDETFVGSLIPFRLAEFHPIFFAEAFDLSVTEHRQAR